MVECHGSQCGFCTPGFVMSLWALYQQHTPGGETPSRQTICDALTGNLCRCTGYRPIIDAGERMMALPAPTDGKLDPKRAEQTAIEVAQAVMRDTPGAASKFEPTVRFHTFHDLGLRGTVTLRASTWGDQGLIRHRFVVAMHDRFRTDGIELVSTAPPKPVPRP